MAELKTYTGGCHCGAVRFSVDAEIERAIDCNCSICSKRGLRLAFTGAETFRLLSGEDTLSSYLFNTHRIDHVFCRACGVESFARGQNPKTGEAVIALNLRCFDEFDLDAVPTHKFDGASL
jgi:hypothetical protein